MDLRERKNKKYYYMSAGRHVVGFEDLSIDVFLGFQNKKYSWILYLIGYIAYGLHLWYKIKMIKEICRKPISPTSCLANSLLSVSAAGTLSSCVPSWASSGRHHVGLRCCHCLRPAARTFQAWQHAGGLMLSMSLYRAICPKCNFTIVYEKRFQQTYE